MSDQPVTNQKDGGPPEPLHARDRRFLDFLIELAWTHALDDRQPGREDTTAST